jgi:hypothetical protein
VAAPAAASIASSIYRVRSQYIAAVLETCRLSLLELLLLLLLLLL